MKRSEITMAFHSGWWCRRGKKSPTTKTGIDCDLHDDYSTIKSGKVLCCHDDFSICWSVSPDFWYQ